MKLMDLPYVGGGLLKIGKEDIRKIKSNMMWVMFTHIHIKIQDKNTGS